MKTKLFSAVLTVLLSVSFYAQSPEKFEQAIQVNFQEMNQAMANSNPELLATYFTEDPLLKF